MEIFNIFCGLMCCVFVLFVRDNLANITNDFTKWPPDLEDIKDTLNGPVIGFTIFLLIFVVLFTWFYIFEGIV